MSKKASNLGVGLEIHIRVEGFQVNEEQRKTIEEALGIRLHELIDEINESRTTIEVKALGPEPAGL